MSDSKYLLFDHGGVLQDTVMELDERDLVLAEHDWGGYEVLRNGKLVLKQVKLLCEKFNFIVGFHSGNNLEDQKQTILLINNAAKKENLPELKNFTLLVMDPSYDESHTPDNPKVTHEKICDTDAIICGYKESNAKPKKYTKSNNEIADGIGKQDVRRALENGIGHINISKSHVFDDGEPNYKIAEDEGYISHWITGENTLFHALEEIIKKEHQVEEEKTTTVDNNEYDNNNNKSENEPENLDAEKIGLEDNEKLQKE